MSRLRISGLIKAKNAIQAQLKSGIPTSEVAAFKQQVTDITSQVEAICKAHNTTPDSLPTPSRNAYKLLKKIDLDNLPIVEDPPAAQPIRKATRTKSAKNTAPKITNAVRLSEDASVYLGIIAPSPTEDNIATALDMMHGHSEQIEQLCADQGGIPADLSVRSKRAYQFFKFLSDETMLRTHLATLKTLQEYGRKPPCSAQMGMFQRLPNLDFQFAIQDALYTAKQKGNTLNVKVSEALIGAPDDVLEAVVCNILTRKKTSKYQKRLKEYLMEPEALEMLTAIEATTGISHTSSVGDYYNLQAGYDQLNAQYFNSNLAPCQLTWGSRMTYRKYGHYDLLRDTIMISKSLDSNVVPSYVVDFVLYHEMLHKRLGVEVINGRRYAHTPEFRRLEKQFPQYEQAEAFLGKLSRQTRRKS